MSRAHERREAIDAYDLLAERPRPHLAALVDLAAQVAAVPKATINIHTEHMQHQVVTHGFPASGCGRGQSMCEYAVDRAAAVMVEDAARDERFATNPFVTGELAEVRFYAAQPLTTPGGVTIGTLCVFDDEVRETSPDLSQRLATIAGQVVDVLELDLVSRRLAQANVELRRANDLLTAFAGQVSHDLKSPLTSVTMAIELAHEELVGSDPAGRPARLLGTAERGAHRMAAMIASLLEFAQLGSTPQRVGVDLSQVAEEVLEDLAAVSRHTRVVVEQLPTVPGDPAQLRAVLQNLVDNALKFSPDDTEVVIGSAQLDRGWRIEVRDQGVGVPKARREEVFEPLARLNRRAPGFGIGLATCRRVIEAHAGRIGLEGNDAGGTTAWFELPA